MVDIFPNCLDLMAINLQGTGEAVVQSKHLPLEVKLPGAGYQHYFPMISNHENKADHAPGEKPEAYSSKGLTWKNPLSPINFNDGAEPITIAIHPGNHLNHGRAPVAITFLPGEHCIFGDGHACVYQFLSSTGKRVIFVSVHSGTGGEGDAFRNLLEGTGINQGRLDRETVLERAHALAGSAVTIEQGEGKIDGLTVSAIARIPPEHFEAYTALPIEDALGYVSTVLSLDSELIEEDLLVIETCGWRLPGEPQVRGLANTSSSVYLGFIKLLGGGSESN